MRVCWLQLDGFVGVMLCQHILFECASYQRQQRVSFRIFWVTRQRLDQQVSRLGVTLTAE